MFWYSASIPQSKEAGQGYTSVGWLSACFVAAFDDAAHRNGAGLEQHQEGVNKQLAASQAKTDHGFPSQPVPPLALSGSGQIRTPAAVPPPVANRIFNGLAGRLKTTPVRLRPQPVNRAAMRAVKAPEKNGFGKTGEISRDKTVSPKALTAKGAGGLGPRKFFAQGG